MNLGFSKFSYNRDLDLKKRGRSFMHSRPLASRPSVITTNLKAVEAVKQD